MKLNLITCNIRFDNPADGENSWSRRRDLLAQTLLKHDPDVIATQEGRYYQLLDLHTLLPGYVLIDEHRSWIKERMYPSFYVKKTNFEILPGADLWLSDTPEIAESRSFDSAFPRLMTWVKLQTKDSKENLLLVNTHLDHIKSSTREQQIKVLVKEIKRFWSGECPIAIMGDFNDGPDSSVRQILLNEMPHLQDAWQLFNPTEETSHHAFKGEMPTGSRIDWIMIDSKLKIIKCQMDKSHLNGRYPSDHFPVICTVSL